MTNEDKALKRMATAINVMRAWSPDWYQQSLLMLSKFCETWQDGLLDEGLISSELRMMELMSELAEAFPDDWMPRIVRWMLLVELGRERTR